MVRKVARNVKILLQNGTYRKLKDCKGRIPLTTVVQHLEPALVQNLMTADIADCKGKTALYYAALQGKNVVEMLIMQEASHKVRYNFRNTIFHVLAKTIKVSLLEYFVNTARLNIEATNSDQQTPLLIAAEIDNLETFRFLLHSGRACKTARYNDRKTQLHLAAVRSHDRIVAEILSWKTD